MSDWYKHIPLVLFFIWSFPMLKYRAKFRAIVYQTDDWKINVQPKFWKELKGLFINLYPDNPEYVKFRRFYGFYLIVYMGLLIWWRMG
ncbi:MAG: hypothetical protein AAF598_18630 [Bacteroidota bacterium]